MSQKSEAKLGIIGGTGVYRIRGLEVVKEHAINTPFGPPSDAVIEASLAGKKVFFLPRHGRGHRISPSEINYRANICALKSFGVNHLISVSAVGIMRENIRPGDLIVPDQLFDRTKGIRPSTFFNDGIVGHVGFADPFCQHLREIVINSARSLQIAVHDGGTYVCMEGPQFSTRAESHFYRKTLDPVAIGMTAIPEAKLAREAEMCFAMIALATDYDCWHETEDDVTADMVMEVLKANAEKANNVLKRIIQDFPEISVCSCHEAAKMSIITSRELLSERTRERLKILFGKYF